MTMTHRDADATVAVSAVTGGANGASGRIVIREHSCPKMPTRAVEIRGRNAATEVAAGDRGAYRSS